MYRKFWLANALAKDETDKEKWFALTDPQQKHFFSDPQGLGFAKTYTVQQVANTDVLIEQKFNNTEISGEIIFYASSPEQQYADYKEFIQYIKHTPITFKQQTPDSTNMYSCDVLITKVEKKETNHDDGAMHIPITMRRLSEWEDSTGSTKVLKNIAIENGKVYDLTREYNYSISEISSSRFNNTGTSDTGFIITIECPAGTSITNPMWTLSTVKDSGETEVYGICSLSGTFTNVIVNSVDDEQSIYLEDANGATILNPKQYRVLTPTGYTGKEVVTFPKFKVGETVFNFTCQGLADFPGTVTISFKNRYATV